MAEFNQYYLYSVVSNEKQSDNDDAKIKEFIRTANAFYRFHLPQTKEEREKFVQDALQGRYYSQTLEFEGESMDFEFTEDYVCVTLHSDNEKRNNKYFKYLRK